MTADITYHRLARRLDAVFFGFLLTGLAIAYETACVISLYGRPSMLVVAPLAILALAVFSLPHNPDNVPLWEQRIRHMKFAALSMLGLAPFVSWHFRSMGNLYFTITGGLCIVAALWLALELSMFMELLFLLVRDYRMASGARIIHYGIGYLLLAPVLVAYCFLVPQMIRDPQVSVHDFSYLLERMPRGVRMAIPLLLMPLPLLAVLLWKGHAAAVTLERAARRSQHSELKTSEIQPD